MFKSFLFIYLTNLKTCFLVGLCELIPFKSLDCDFVFAIFNIEKHMQLMALNKDLDPE